MTIDQDAIYKTLRNSGYVTSDQASELADALVKKMTEAPVKAGPRDFKAEYKEQKALPKKEVYKLKPGTWIEVRWLDAPNSVCLLSDRVEPGPGDVDVFVQPVVDGTLSLLPRSTCICHDQIVATHGRLVVAAPKPYRN